MNIYKLILIYGTSILSAACSQTATDNPPITQNTDIPTEIEQIETELPDKTDSQTLPLAQEDVSVNLDLLYDRYTLADRYPYKDTVRSFKWPKIRAILAQVENIQQDDRPWVVMQNYRNRNQEAPLVKSYVRNAYDRIADTLGVERFQSVPLYHPTDTTAPLIYGRDGTLAYLNKETANFCEIQIPTTQQIWLVPKRYLYRLDHDTRFHHVIVVDRKEQNITTLEWAERGKWLIRSKNPATTGQRKPPYAQATPLGMFLMQEQKRKMIFLKDGSQETGGYAPYASRFTNGAYIHGVPVNSPQTEEIEYSWSLGTIPRSHMCVRNATSHARFIYEWAPVQKSLIVVIE